MMPDGQALSEYLKAHPEAYGDVAPYEGGGGLPYLYKAPPRKTRKIPKKYR